MVCVKLRWAQRHTRCSCTHLKTQILCTKISQHHFDLDVVHYCALCDVASGVAMHLAHTFS